MDEKKQKILYSAIRFFSEKGYYATSVQEIAKDCGISKGSLYKYFQSKEELFIEVFHFFQNQMFEKVMNIQFDQGLSKKEQFKKQILVEAEDFLEKKDFILMQFKELPNQNNEEMIPLFQQARVRMMNWRKQEILNAYGNEVQSYIWDLVIIFQGILKEVLMFMIHEDMYISLKDLSTSVVKRMDAIVASYQPEEHPLFLASYMTEYDENAQLSTSEQLTQIINDMVQVIQNEKIKLNRKDELQSTLSLLKIELKQKEKRWFLIQALLAYLERESELKGYVQHIENLMKIERN